MLPMIQPGGPSGSPPPFDRVGIVGYGLMGGSLGLALKRAWPSMLVVGVDNKDVIEAAIRMHALDVGGDDLGLVSDTQLIVLAAPVLTNNRVLASLADMVPGEAMVTDIGSTKRTTLAAARTLPPRLLFIGGHPLAGAAVSGIQSARGDLFAGRPWILTPSAETDNASMDRLATLIDGIGARLHTMTAETHDSLLASISHMPQVIASALMRVVGEAAGEEGLALAGRGLRDTTRLASSPPGIWTDIMATNRDNVAAAIDALVGLLLEVRSDLDGSRGTLAQTFESAARWKADLERHFGE